MISKLLKIELLLSFIITTIAFFSFYSGEQLPDNFYSISSASDSLNFLSYYMTTLVYVIGYFTGPWLILSFFLFSLFYTFVFSRRESAIDLLNVFTLSGTILFLVYLLFPSFIGKGLSYILLNSFSTFTLLFSCLICLLSFLAGTFRENFQDTVMRCFDFVLNMPRCLSDSFDKFQQSGRKKLTPRSSISSKLKIALPGLLKGESDSIAAPSFVQNALTNQNVPNQDENLKETLVSRSIPSFLRKTSDADSCSGKNKFNNLDDSHNTKTDTRMKATSPNKRQGDRGFVGGLINSKAGGSNEEKYYSIVSSMHDDSRSPSQNQPDSKYFTEIVALIEEKLGELKIDGKIVNVIKGPVVDTFELDIGPGVKVSRVTGATDDLALALYGAPVRIVSGMAGKTTIGIEVPRNPREYIYLDEILGSKVFKETTQYLPVGIGKDVYGDAFVKDLTTMPHMLVAGATGAGKSVFINALLVSLLVKKSPRQMKLILIDPKQLELALYQKLPHLIMPVVTDAKTASIALLWAVQEMERRYSILKEMGVRSIAGFNEKIKNASPEQIAAIHQFYEDQGAEEYELPYLVIIVDEFADLILTKAGKEIENNIARLAAKARAAGIHLVLATQRPSVDVITGVIKSNFPTRVSFRVTSGIDSRTILDKLGAERLLGKGDMLFKSGIEMNRVHSSFVKEEEIEALVAKLKDIPQEFSTNAIDFIENGGELETDEYTYGTHISFDDKSNDEYYGQALKIVVETRAASASMLQRRLKIGYNRAANLIDELESKGVIGPAQGSKPRKVLVGNESV